MNRCIDNPKLDIGSIGCMFLPKLGIYCGDVLPTLVSIRWNIEEFTRKSCASNSYKATVQTIFAIAFFFCQDAFRVCSLMILSAMEAVYYLGT